MALPLLRRVVASTLFCATSVVAGEGMFLLDQIPQLRSQQQLPPTEVITSAASAMVKINGCTGAFVSNDGLILTNRHCLINSIQQSSIELELVNENGFYAATGNNELALQGSVAQTVVSTKDVTSELQSAQDTVASDPSQSSVRERLINTCEVDTSVRCSIVSFDYGTRYSLIGEQQLTDLRLVYFPSKAIGQFGGVEERWNWPRHAADVAFVRAYDRETPNMPVKPAHFLSFAETGGKEGDAVFALGFPHKTSRFTRAVNSRYTFEWFYPTYLSLAKKWLAALNRSTEDNAELAMRYEPVKSRLRDFINSTKQQISAAVRGDLVNANQQRDDALRLFLLTYNTLPDALKQVERLDKLMVLKHQLNKQQFWLNNLTRPELLRVALLLYGNALERAQPNGIGSGKSQERYRNQIEQRLLQRRDKPNAAVDSEVLEAIVGLYVTRPADEKVAAFDQFLADNRVTDPQFMQSLLTRFYQNSRLDDIDYRLSLLRATVDELESLEDPLMRLAIALYKSERDITKSIEKIDIEAQELFAVYGQALVAMQRSEGKVMYPDANGTLRLTLGKIAGVKPVDGLIYEAFTTLAGIAQKHYGIDPFNAPESLRNAIENESEKNEVGFGQEDNVFVNFLSTLDSTGGHSGSPTLNYDGDVIGVLFDGTTASLNSDWQYNDSVARSVHVDVRYILWLLTHVENANELVEELEISKVKNNR